MYWFKFFKNICKILSEERNKRYRYGTRLSPCLSDLGGAPLPVARRPIMKATAPRVRLPKWPFHLQRGGSRNRISRRAFQDEAKRNSLGVLKASSKFDKMSVLGSMMNPLAKERMKEAEDRHR